MGIIELLIAVFVIGCAIAVANALFGPFNIPPRLVQAGSIILFLIFILLILSALGYGPAFGLR